MNEPLEPIPNNAQKPLDLAKIAAEAATNPPGMSLRDACSKFGFVHCRVCYRGGHTGTQLFTVYTDPTGREKVKACVDHVGRFIRPKDVGRK